MIRQDGAIEWFTMLREKFTKTEYAEYLDMAIKALEQQPCEDAISRADVKKYLSAPDANGDRVIYESDLDLLPSVNPQPKVGYWIFHEPFDNGRKNCNECIECSQCHTWLGYDCYAKTPYCPNCGAKMESEVQE